MYVFKRNVGNINYQFIFWILFTHGLYNESNALYICLLFYIQHRIATIKLLLFYFNEILF